MNLRTAKVSNYQFQDLLQPMLPSGLAETCDNPHLDQQKQLNTSLISTDQNHGFSGHPISPGLMFPGHVPAPASPTSNATAARPASSPAAHRLPCGLRARRSDLTKPRLPRLPRVGFRGEKSIGRNLVGWDREKKGEFGNMMKYVIVQYCTYIVLGDKFMYKHQRTHTHTSTWKFPPYWFNVPSCSPYFCPHLRVE